jgi:hypothetical protein
MHKNFHKFFANAGVFIYRFFMFKSLNKTIYAVISVVLISCSNAQAANWNTTGKSLDINSLSLAPVPKSFPQYAMTLDEECKTSDGKKWSSTISGFYGDGLFWASIHAYRRDWVRIYEGKPVGNDGYIIRAAEAAKKWKDNSNWIAYKSSAKDIKTALLRGLVGRYASGGGYWRECKLTARSLSDDSKISLSKERPFGRQWSSLNTIVHKQKIALEAMLELGVRRTSGYDFKRAQDAIAAAVESEKNARIAKQRETQRKRALELAAKKKAEEEAKRAAELAAKKKAEEEAKRAAELAAKKKAEEEAKRAAELAAKKKAEEEAKRAAELAAKKKAKEEVSPEAKLAAKKKAEEEAKRAAELAAKKKAEEETKRAAELAAKKKADEETKRAAELAAKKKAEEEAKRVALKKAISEAQKEAAQLYGFAIQYVKDGLASDVVAWSKDYSAAPKLDNKWGEEELTGYNSFKSKVFANQAFKNYVDEKKSTVQDQIRQQKKNTLSALAAAKDKLEPLIIERFGEDSAEGISRLIEKINFELEKNLDNETLEQKNLDSLLQSASRLIEDDQRVKNIAEALSSLSSKIEALDLTEMTADLAKKAQDLSSQLSEVKNMGVAELETFSKRAEFIVKSLDEQLAKNQARAAKKAKDLADKKFKELNQTAESLDLDLFSQRWRKSNREVLREEWVNKYVKISVVLMNIIKAEEESVILVYESATPSLFASNSVSITIKKSGTWPSANPKQFESLKNEILTGKWRSRKGKKGTVYGVINEIDERGTIVLDGDMTFFY